MTDCATVVYHGARLLVSTHLLRTTDLKPSALFQFIGELEAVDEPDGAIVCGSEENFGDCRLQMLEWHTELTLSIFYNFSLVDLESETGSPNGRSGH